MVCVECISEKYHLVDDECLDCADEKNKEKCLSLKDSRFHLDVEYEINLEMRFTKEFVDIEDLNSTDIFL